MSVKIGSKIGVATLLKYLDENPNEVFFDNVKYAEFCPIGKLCTHVLGGQWSFNGVRAAGNSMNNFEEKERATTSKLRRVITKLDEFTGFNDYFPNHVGQIKTMTGAEVAEFIREHA